MKCPLLRIPIANVQGGDRGKADECIQEKCAWWCKDLECCDPTGLIPTFQAIGNVLGKIADDLPREFTPRST